MSSFKFFLDDDLFWHLSTGRYIVENKTVPSQDVFGYVTQGQEWVPFEWAWDVTTYFVYSMFGYTGISIFRSLLALLIFFFIFKTADKLKINFALTAALSLLLLIGMLTRLSPRPHLVSYLFITVLMYLLLKYMIFDKGNIKGLYPMPMIFLVWANFHMGVIIGVFILLSFYVSDYLLNKNSKSKDNSNSKKLLYIVLLSLAAILVNPHFFNTYLYVYSHTEMKMLNEINEWKSPFSSAMISNYYVLIFFFFAALSLTIFSYYKKTKNLFPIFLFLGLGFLALRAQRYTVDFELALFPLILISINSFIKLDNNKQKFISYALAGVTTLLIFYSANDKFYKETLNNNFRETGFGLNKDFFPVEMFDFIKANKIDDPQNRPFNSLRAGGYLTWQLPGNKNLIDSRNLNDDIYFKYKTIEQKRPGFEKLINDFGINYFAFSTPYLKLSANELNTSVISWLSKNSDDWKLIYWDDKSSLFVKNDSKFSNVIQNYEYKYLTPFNIVFAPAVLAKAFTDDKETLLREARRKAAEEPQGMFTQDIKNKYNIK